jgi:hypothetical protein
MPLSHTQIIDLFPSLATFAADLNQKVDTARRWRLRNSIPATFWAAVVSAAEARGIAGVTLGDLASAAPARGAVGRPPFRNGAAPANQTAAPPDGDTAAALRPTGT